MSTSHVISLSQILMQSNDLTPFNAVQAPRQEKATEEKLDGGGG